jgi:hypothetical protein
MTSVAGTALTRRLKVQWGTSSLQCYFPPAFGKAPAVAASGGRNGRYLEPTRWDHCWGMGDERMCVLEYDSKRPQRSFHASQTNSPPPMTSMYLPSRCWSLSA